MIAALIPCYNSGPAVAGVIARTLEYLPCAVAVDDGSTDDTADVLAATPVRVLRQETNRGKGSSLLLGFRHLLEQPDLEAVITLDSDGQHDPASIPDFIACFRETGAGIVVGHRLGDTRAIPPLRRFANVASTRLIGWVAGRPLADAQCGYRLYAADALRRLLPAMREGRYELETDVLLVAARAGIGIAFVPIETIYSDEAGKRSHWSPLRDSWRIGKVLLRRLARRAP